MIVMGSCEQCGDLWNWLAIYRDGEQLPECTGTGTHHVFADIELDRLESLAWIPIQAGLPQVVVVLSEPTMRPILFRRRQVELNMVSETMGARQTIHCLGWQKNLGDGCNVESFTFLFEDGSLLTSPDRNAV